MSPGPRARVLAAGALLAGFAGTVALGAPRVSAGDAARATPLPVGDGIAVSTGPQYQISPPTARPGEVVHIRFPTVQRLASGYTVAWLNDPAFQVPLQVFDPKYGAEADLPVPPGTSRGPYPIVVLGPNQTRAVLVGKSSRLLVLPFLVSESEGPPTWRR